MPNIYNYKFYIDYKSIIFITKTKLILFLSPLYRKNFYFYFWGKWSDYYNKIFMELEDK